jgi:cytochrome c peroxidase
MSGRLRRPALRVALAVALTGMMQTVPADSDTLKPCAPTTVRVGKTAQVVPPAQDVRFGQCLFNSTIDFNQANPSGMFASCNGCHPGNRTDQGTHAVMITNQLGTFVGARQVPNLLNVQFNVPLGWDGRHGGVLGNQASIIAAIKSAATGAINSPVEMAGHIDPNNPVDQAKLAALAAFVISRSPTTPDPHAAPPPPPSPPTLDPTDPDAAADAAEAAARAAAADAATLARIKTGADVFFGRSVSTQGLLAAGKACVSCHVPPFFTDNKIRTNVLHPDAAYDFGFRQANGSSGPDDAGAGLTTVTDPVTGKSVQVGTFKTPSLHHFYPDGEPALHSGIFAEDGRLFHFYETSLGFTLGPGESTGLHYWLVNCPQGPARNPFTIPAECN